MVNTKSNVSEGSVGDPGVGEHVCTITHHHTRSHSVSPPCTPYPDSGSSFHSDHPHPFLPQEAKHFPFALLLFGCAIHLIWKRWVCHCHMFICCANRWFALCRNEITPSQYTMKSQSSLPSSITSQLLSIFYTFLEFLYDFLRVNVFLQNTVLNVMQRIRIGKPITNTPTLSLSFVFCFSGRAHQRPPLSPSFFVVDRFDRFDWTLSHMFFLFSFPFPLCCPLSVLSPSLPHNRSTACDFA